MITKSTILEFPEFDLVGDMKDVPDEEEGSNFLINTKTGKIWKNVNDERYQIIFDGNKDKVNSIKHLRAWIRINNGFQREEKCCNKI